MKASCLWAGCFGLILTQIPLVLKQFMRLPAIRDPGSVFRVWDVSTNYTLVQSPAKKQKNTEPNRRCARIVFLIPCPKRMSGRRAKEEPTCTWLGFGYGWLVMARLALHKCNFMFWPESCLRSEVVDKWLTDDDGRPAKSMGIYETQSRSKPSIPKQFKAAGRTEKNANFRA